MAISTVETRGRLIYIEPNEFAAEKGAKFGKGVSPDNIMWNPEDMNMAVDLQVVIPHRDDCGDNTEFDVNITTDGSSFMHNFVSFFGGTDIGKNSLKSTDRALTDSYTDISYNEIRSGYKSDKECLGISSIDIRFDSHFYPVVNMKFTDVRGYSLFMPAEEQYKDELGQKYAYKNFFQAVFHFPYPRFLLTIKGFYGNKVTFILAVNEFKSALNSQTGNIDVDISFIGYMYGLYTEIPMSMIMCAPYIDLEEGTSVNIDNIDSVYGSYWNRGVDEGRFVTMDDGVPLPTMLEFLVKYVNVVDQLDYDTLPSVGEIADNNRETKMLNDIKGIANLVKEFIEKGEDSGVTKKVADSESGNYTLIRLNDEVTKSEFRERDLTASDATITKVFESGRIENENASRLKNYLTELFAKIKEYNESDYRSGSELNYPFYGLTDKTSFFNFYRVTEERTNYVEIDGGNKTEVYDNVPKIGDMLNSSRNPTGRMTIENAIKLFPTLSEDIFREKLAVNDCLNDKLENVTKYTCPAFTIFSYNRLINDVDRQIKILEGETKKVEEEANNEINELFTNALGFRCDLENVYRMIFAHIDCFMHEFNENCLRLIKSEKNSGKRRFIDLGLSHNSRQTDVKAKSDACFVPPFFALYNEKREIEYPGNTIIGNSEVLKSIYEVQFVEKLNDAAKMCGKVYKSVAELVAANDGGVDGDENGSSETKADIFSSIGWKYNCCTDFLYGIRNPYSLIDIEEGNAGFSNVFYMLFLRLYNLIKFGDNNVKKYDLFFDNEFTNITNALPDRISNDMYNELKEYKDLDLDKLLLKINTKVNKYNGRFSKKELTCSKGIGYGIEIDDVPVYCDRDPLLERGNNSMTLKYKEGALIIKNLDSYGAQINERFNVTDKTLRSTENLKLKSDDYIQYLAIAKKSAYAYDGCKVLYDNYDKGNIAVIGDKYQQEKNNINNQFWYTFKRTAESQNNNFFEMLTNGYIRNLVISNGLNADGVEIWDRLNGIDVTNYQLTLASYLLASVLPSKTDINVIFSLIYDNKSNGIGCGFKQNLKCVMLYMGSLIYRARKIKKYGKDVIYHHSKSGITDLKYTSIVDMTGLMHCDKGYLLENTAMVDALKMYIGKYAYDVEEYLTWDNDDGWYDSNSKYSTLESYFCDWVVEEFLPIYNSFFDKPRVLGEDERDNHYGFKKYRWEDETRKKKKENKIETCVNQECRLNDFMCNLLTERVYSYAPECYLWKSDEKARQFKLITLQKERIESYLKNLIKRLSTYYSDDVKHEDVLTQALREGDETNKEIKKAMYYSLKNLYDKWICSYGSIDKFTLQTAAQDRIAQKKRFKEGKGQNDNGCKKEYNNFLYVDSFYNYIGERFMVNPMELYELIKRYGNGDTNNSVYEFMAEIAEKNKLLMIALPVFTNFYSKENVQDIFTPHDIYNANDKQRDGFNNTYVIMYTHEASKHLDVISNEEIGYEGDGYDLADSLGKIGDIAAQIYDEKTGDPLNLNVNAFGVTYAMQNQSYFRNISVNMDNPIVTDYSIANQLQLSQTATHGDVYYPFGIGQNIYSIYSNRSYTCTVEMFGCANIMPMMYFQLNNVPMFKGAYMIVSVSHSIRAGQMITTFTGIRQSKYLTPFNQVIFDLTGIADRAGRNKDGNAGTSGSRRRNRGSRRVENDDSGNPILVASSSTQAALKDAESKLKTQCFPKDEDGNTVIPITKVEMDKYVTAITVPVHYSQTETRQLPITVNKGFVETVKKVFNEIYSKKVDGKFIEIHTLGSYSWRTTKTTDGGSTNSPSIHAYGLALDINAGESQGNPWFGSYDALANDNQDTITKWRTWQHPLVETMEKYGIGWGRFRKSFDSMHFCAVIDHEVEDEVDKKMHKVCK